MSKRKATCPEFKAKGAFEALKGEPTVALLARRLGGHPTIIHNRNMILLEEASEPFERGDRTTPL